MNTVEKNAAERLFWAVQTRSRSQDYRWVFSSGNPDFRAVCQQAQVCRSEDQTSVCAVKRGDDFFLFIGDMRSLGTAKPPTDYRDRQIKVNLIIGGLDSLTIRGLILRVLDNWESPGALFPDIVSWIDKPESKTGPENDPGWEVNQSALENAAFEARQKGETAGLEFPVRWEWDNSPATREILRPMVRYCDFSIADGIKLVVGGSPATSSACEQIRQQAHVFFWNGYRSSLKKTAT